MAAEARKPKESGEERAAQIRVLIAEDNMINMKVAMGILRRMGYEQVRSSFSALSIVNNQLSSDNAVWVGACMPCTE